VLWPDNTLSPGPSCYLHRLIPADDPHALALLADKPTPQGEPSEARPVDDEKHTAESLAYLRAKAAAASAGSAPVEERRQRVPRDVMVAETNEWARANFVPAVREIISTYGRLGPSALAKHLNEEGVDSRTGGDWTATTGHPLPAALGRDGRVVGTGRYRFTTIVTGAGSSQPTMGAWCSSASAWPVGAELGEQPPGSEGHTA
jgi:hypothetical protein